MLIPSSCFQVHIDASLPPYAGVNAYRIVIAVNKGGKQKLTDRLANFHLRHFWRSAMQRSVRWCWRTKTCKLYFIHKRLFYCNSISITIPYGLNLHCNPTCSHFHFILYVAKHSIIWVGNKTSLLRRRLNIKTTIHLLICFTGIFALLAAKKRFAYFKVFCKRLSGYKAIPFQSIFLCTSSDNS
jgi:hypothetical protein